jgi:SAM-dependent methyltransferase
MFSEQRFEEAEQQVDLIVEIIGAKPISILDLCCGPGRFSTLFAKQGCRVTGVDLSPFLLGKARERAKTEGLAIEYVQADMREFSRPDRFDLVMNFFTSFGYFDNKADDMVVLRRIFENLKPGGHCLIELFGKELLARIFQESRTQESEDGSLLLVRHEIFDDWTRIRNEWTLIRGEKARTFKFHHTIYSGQELKDRMESVGFSSVRLYGGLDGSDYGIDSKRLVVVGQKEPAH